MNLRMYLRLPTHRELQTVSLKQQLPSQQQFLEPQLLPVQQVQPELPVQQVQPPVLVQVLQ